MSLCVCLYDTVLIYFDIYSVCVFLPAFVFLCVWRCVRTSGGGMLPADGQINRLIARGMCVGGRGTRVTGATSLTCQKFVRVVKDVWHAEPLQQWMFNRTYMTNVKNCTEYWYWVWIGWVCTRFAWRSRMFHVRIFATHSGNALNAD